MRQLVNFSANVAAQFENNYDNMLQFNELVLNASRGVYNKYSKEETNTVIRNMFNKVLGINFKTATPRDQRLAWRDHGKEVCTLIEDVLLDKMQSGWNQANARFMDFVDDRNINDGDKQEFFVNDESLFVVSQFAGDHHDIVRQHVKPGKAFTVDMSAYTVKCYVDFRDMQLGKIDLAAMIERMYTSIEKARYDALYTAFMGIDENLPTDLKLETPVTEATKDSIIELAELVKSVTGYDVMFVGSRVAIQKLQNTVSYNMFSNDMKNERNQNGILANWEGYECLPLSRVNKTGTRDNLLDNTKIFIIPIDPDFKPIKRVNSGDLQYLESGMDGSKKDMTADVEIAYWEGVGVVVNQLFGEVVISS